MTSSYANAGRRLGLISLAGIMAAILTETPVSADKGGFLAISDYTMFDQTLPDGKNPVWVYYLSDGPNAIVVRIVMPSMDICEVTPQSKRDVDIFTARASHHLVRGSREWKFAEEAWQIAFERYLVVGRPQRC